MWAGLAPPLGVVGRLLLVSPFPLPIRTPVLWDQGPSVTLFHLHHLHHLLKSHLYLLSPSGGGASTWELSGHMGQLVTGCSMTCHGASESGAGKRDVGVFSRV